MAFFRFKVGFQACPLSDKSAEVFSPSKPGMGSPGMLAILGPAKIGICLEFSRDFANFEESRAARPANRVTTRKSS